MTDETSGASRHLFNRNVAKNVSSESTGVDGNETNICLQTGEEFSTEFLRDRVGLRRILDQKQLRIEESNYIQNFHVNNEDIAHVQSPRRKDYDFEALSFVPRIGPETEVENRSFPDNISGKNWIYGPNGQEQCKYPDGMNLDREVAGPMANSKYVADSPRSYHLYGTEVPESPLSGKVKFLCSFGGKILPRPSDGKLRYTGGETRILSIRKSVTLDELLKKTIAICNQSHTIKYQLPGEDLDALISVCSDEDLHHMIEEYHELERNGGSQKLRIFLVSSSDSDSKNSFEVMTPRKGQTDYHYVSAVNGLLDFSPRNNTSGQSLAGQTTQLITGLNQEQSFHRDSPALLHASDNKDFSLASSNLVDSSINPAVQLLPALKMQNKVLNESPPVSPMTIERGKKKIDSQFCADGYGLNGNELFNQNQNHHHYQYTAQTAQINKSPLVHFHNRTPSGDLLPYPVHTSDTNSERHTIKERTFSDSRLQDHNEGSNYCLEQSAIPLSLWSNGRENSPLLKISNSSEDCLTPRQEKIDDKEYVHEHEDPRSLTKRGTLYSNQEGIKSTHKNLAPPVEGSKQHAGNVEPGLNSHLAKLTNLANLKYLPHVHRQLGESPDPEKIFPACNLQLGKGEKSVDTMRENPYGPYQAGVDVSDLDMESQNFVKDKQFAMTQRMAGQPAFHLNTECIGSPQRVSDYQEPSLLTSDSIANCTSTKAISLHDEGIEKSSSKHEKVSNTEQIDGFKIEMAQYAQPHNLSYRYKNGELESSVIIEDVTNKIPQDIPISASIVPHVEEEATDAFPSITDVKDIEDDGRHMNESTADAAMDEKGSEIYGLQIIKNTDIEELQELGSGTFGTVYYGKWRGTDVAIKRIKKSCFDGKKSEQERLIKDFWREARILSNLHHPNVVAFYGVVPDGPEGMMTTVTEYMVNGSLRQVLQKKDRTLDRRKKLMIALDAAVGMEYLHLKNIVHFDLKCENLLVNLRDPQRPICKVGDFGLSRVKCNTLVSGGVRGTLPWMAPELLDGSSNSVSEKVDVYSFGIALWEILTGEEPYANMHCGAIIGGIVSNTLRPPLPERCDSEWRKLIEDCWSFDPAVRPSFTEISDRLRAMSKALQPKRRNIICR
ncbi:hypothetical protein K2173_003649 [Erythroxylum novogranatense]|uniref:Protein kinase domain-containing protein n=1 Tax=Erythroxylum novogranatense TaxID=1862640 RepID=A0AAV8TAM3_9ROSI|nr:hypothetical protein K2173_003649 [Erythroxylum novogranatense]